VAEGIRFLSAGRYQQYLDGLEIDVRDFYGHECLIAFNPSLDGGGCGL
jgi:hypothetical protein